MKRTINATGLFLLMSLTTVAHPTDSAKKDSCCTIKTAGTAKTVSVMPASDDHSNTGNTAAIAFSTEDAKAIMPNPDQIQEADAQMNIQYVSFDLHYNTKAFVNKADALTELQIQSGFMNQAIGKVTAQAVRNADAMINESYKKTFNIEAADFQSANLSKMLIESDKAINEHFKKVCGMEVATSH